MKANNYKADLHIKQSGGTIFLNMCLSVCGGCFGGCGLVGGAVRQQSHKHIWRSLQRQSCRVTPAGQKHSSQCSKWIWWKPSFSVAHYSDWWTVHCLRWLTTSARTWRFRFTLISFDLNDWGEPVANISEKKKKKLTPTTSDLSFWCNWRCLETVYSLSSQSDYW